MLCHFGRLVLCHFSFETGVARLVPKLNSVTMVLFGDASGLRQNDNEYC